MTSEENDSETVGVDTFEIALPDEEWFEERLDDTRFDNPGDFLTQMLDESAMIAAQIEEFEATDEVTIELPSDSVQQFEQLRKSFEERGEMDIDELLSFLITSIYIQERAQFGSI